MNNTISVSAMLNEINLAVNDTTAAFFSIEFVKKGKNENDTERGKVKKIMTASKSFKKNYYEDKKPNQRHFYRVKEQGLLVIYDHDAGHSLSILIDLIIKYNGLRVTR